MKKKYYYILIILIMIISGCWKGTTPEDTIKLNLKIYNKLITDDIYIEAKISNNLVSKKIEIGSNENIGEVTSSAVDGLNISFLMIYKDSSKTKLIYSYNKDNEKDREKELNNFENYGKNGELIFNMTEDKIIK